jgi:mutator protein MutT
LEWGDGYRISAELSDRYEASPVYTSSETEKSLPMNKQDPDNSKIQNLKSKMLHPVPAIGAIILQGSEILLVRRGHEPGRGKWSIPGGSVEWGETLEEAVRREVLEETGLAVDVGEFAGISDLIVYKDNEITFHYVLINYFAEVVSGTPVASSDADEVRWVPLSEVRNLDITLSLLHRLSELGMI